jgi:ketosteroid isomerase-like protein
MTSKRLSAFDEAWNAHDVDAIMSFLTKDCVYHASAGLDLMGATFRGQDEVRAAFTATLQRFPDAHFDEAIAFVAGDRGCTEWTFTGTDTDGTSVRFQGCDMYEFEGDRIAVKNAFRKALV